MKQGLTMNKKLPTILSVASAIFVLSANSIFAQEEVRKLVIGGTSDEAGSLSVILEADPGQTKTGSTNVTNLSTDTLKVKTSFADFVVDNEEGIPTIVETGSSVWSMSLWASVSAEDEEFFLEPNETKEVEFTIDVPQDATPGGHYAMILFTPAIVQEEEIAGPLIEHKVGNLIKMTVSGEIYESAEIVEFSAPYFSEFGPIDLTLRILNDGNTHIPTSGSVKIYNTLNQEVAEWEIQSANVFPTAIRAWDTTWEGKWRFGLYNAEVEVMYGSEDTPLTADVFFWIIPWRLILAITAVITLLIIWGYAIEKKNKSTRKNKSIKKENTAEENIESIFKEQEHEKNLSSL